MKNDHVHERKRERERLIKVMFKKFSDHFLPSKSLARKKI